MPVLECATQGQSIIVRSDWWQVEHRRDAGGCWGSIRFFKGSGRNLLRSPVTSRIRFCQVLPSATEESACYPVFEERFERQPKILVERGQEGTLVVTAEGQYRDRSGQAIPVKFRHRYEYRDWGLVASALEIIADGGCPGVVDVCAVDLRLRAGMTHAYVREHPAVNPSVDLRHGFRWLTLGAGVPGFQSKHVPIHVLCFEKGVEGIDLFPTSDLAEWDTGLSPDAGLGHYQVAATAKGETAVSFNPYCFAFRRVPITLAGRKQFHLYWGLPFIKDRARIGMGLFNAATSSRWASDAELERLAHSGVKLLRFHNDYREDGPFWHDGAYPPYDAAGMAQLGRVIATAHRLGMKVVPYISLKEFHPASPGYAEHADEWAQAPAPSVREVHTWCGSGEYGRIMCLASGWLDRRKQDVDTILSDLPWDGLYFDWAKPLPCRHPDHLHGDFHTDTDGYLDFLFYCRRRVGPEGFLFVHLSGHPYIVGENLADLVRLNDDLEAFVPSPGRLPIQCDFMPIAPRQMKQLAAGMKADSPAARELLLASILEGCPPSGQAKYPKGDFCGEALAETGLFAEDDFSQYRFARASESLVNTGLPTVHAALWYRTGGAIVYLVNLSLRKARGAFRFDTSRLGRKPRRVAPLHITCRTAPSAAKGEGEKEMTLSPTAFSARGVPYSLGPLSSALYRIEGA